MALIALFDVFNEAPARFSAAVVEDPRVGVVPNVPDAGDDRSEVEENKLPTPPMLGPTLDKPALEPKPEKIEQLVISTV